jgi:hypothetical protein
VLEVMARCTCLAYHRLPLGVVIPCSLRALAMPAAVVMPCWRRASMVAMVASWTIITVASQGQRCRRTPERATRRVLLLFMCPPSFSGGGRYASRQPAGSSFVARPPYPCEQSKCGSLIVPPKWAAGFLSGPPSRAFQVVRSQALLSQWQLNETGDVPLLADRERSWPRYRIGSIGKTETAGYETVEDTERALPGRYRLERLLENWDGIASLPVF